MANTSTPGATGRMQLFGTRTVINTAVNAAPGHNQTRLYSAGEQYVIGSLLMPQGLSTQLVKLGVATEDGTAVSGTLQSQDAVNAANLFNPTSPQPEPW